MDDGGNDRTELAAVKAAKVGLPAALALYLDRLGFRDVGEGASGATSLVSCAPAPHPLFILALCSGGPPTIKGWMPPIIKGWTPPIRARIKGLKGRWAYLVGDQPNILPLDLTLFF